MHTSTLRQAPHTHGKHVHSPIHARMFAHAIAPADLEPAVRRRGGSGGRPERFAPLEALVPQRRIDSMTLRELQVCMQLHRVRYDDISSEAEVCVLCVVCLLGGL